MENCIFCKIVKGDIPSTKVFEDDLVLAFKDIEPQAPVHVLVAPKEHYKSVMEVPTDLVAHMVAVSKSIVESERLAENGFRLVINTGKDGGQSVAHLHMHILGGRSLQWPPG